MALKLKCKCNTGHDFRCVHCGLSFNDRIRELDKDGHFEVLSKTLETLAEEGKI